MTTIEHAGFLLLESECLTRTEDYYCGKCKAASAAENGYTIQVEALELVENGEHG